MDLGVVTSAEDAVAVTDVAGKTRVGYLPTLDGMFAVVEQSLAVAHAHDIDEYVIHFNDAATASASINAHRQRASDRGGRPRSVLRSGRVRCGGEQLRSVWSGDYRGRWHGSSTGRFT